MKKIFVRKVFPYDPTFNGKYSKYDGYSLISLQKASPGINGFIKFKPSRIVPPIFSSTLKRGKETAMAISKENRINYKIITELNEIRFDLRNLVTSEEYSKFGSNLVRKRFIEAFIKDKLKESRKSLEMRIRKLIKKIEKFPDGNYLLISHSFFMKILQTYLKNEKLFLTPKILRKKFNYRRKTFDFGKGFSFYHN